MEDEAEVIFALLPHSLSVQRLGTKKETGEDGQRPVWNALREAVT